MPRSQPELLLYEILPVKEPRGLFLFWCWTAKKTFVMVVVVVALMMTVMVMMVMMLAMEMAIWPKCCGILCRQVWEQSKRFFIIGAARKDVGKVGLLIFSVKGGGGTPPFRRGKNPLKTAIALYPIKLYCIFRWKCCSKQLITFWECKRQLQTMMALLR